MTQEQIAKGNALIAEFLGWEKVSEGEYMFPNLYPSKDYTGETQFSIAEAAFHEYWDWLIPALHKFDNLYETDKRVQDVEHWDEYVMYSDGIDSHAVLYEIDHVYPVLINALEWYYDTVVTKTQPI